MGAFFWGRGKGEWVGRSQEVGISGNSKNGYGNESNPTNVSADHWPTVGRLLADKLTDDYCQITHHATVICRLHVSCLSVI